MDKEKYFDTKGIKGWHQLAIAKETAKALTHFCEQEPEFEQAIEQSGKSYQECLDSVCKNVGASISDLEAYSKAVKFYFSTAEIHFNMTIDLSGGNGYEAPPITKTDSKAKEPSGLNKMEMELLKNTSCSTLSEYLALRKADKRTNETERLEVVRKYTYRCENIAKIMKITGLSLRKTVNYIEAQGEEYTVVSDWGDYLGQCRQLEYDVTDTLISMPKKLSKAHTRLTRIIKVKADELMQKELEKTTKARQKYEYTSLDGSYMVVLPKSVQQIIDEGKRLDHCVGGYAERHAKGALTILFLRTTDKPDVPYYTMEVDAYGRIAQCRGFKNNTAGNPKPQSIKDFEAEYQAYLDKVYKKTRRKSA